MAYEFIKYRKEGRIAYVTIDRNERLNALHPPANSEMQDAFADFRDDPEVWVAILTGTGERAFSAGNDLKYAAEHSNQRDSQTIAAPFGGIVHSFTCWKPIIAAVNGYALGGGFELAMACDIILAADHAQFGLPEPRVGLVAAPSAVHLFPRHVPIKLAMGLMLTGRQMSAEEALRVNLVNETMPLADLMLTAERWAAEIMEGAPLAIRATKQMAMSGLDWPMEIANSRNYSEHQRAMASADRIEGPKAFSEKRKPNWTGR